MHFIIFNSILEPLNIIFKGVMFVFANKSFYRFDFDVLQLRSILVFFSCLVHCFVAVQPEHL